ncbi:MAG: hypothetical protein K6D96_07045 [Acetatifactor sp.]|nr:hypothetical protein [Acetatifactor sp.]
MSELMMSALREMAKYNGRSKFLGLFLISLFIIFVFLREKKSFQIYGLIMFLALICPVTGALLWKYQTRFFDYLNLLYLMPVSVITAYGAVKIYDLINEKIQKRYMFYIFFALVVYISGNFGLESITELDRSEEDLSRAKVLLEAVSEEAQGQRVIIWGPEFLMENVRILSENIYPVYGRDMFEESIKAYTYDTYDEDVIFLYEAMSALENKADATEVESNPSTEGKALISGNYADKSADEILNKALDIAEKNGVYAILIPAGADEAAEVIEKRTGESGMEIEGLKLYYLE